MATEALREALRQGLEVESAQLNLYGKDTFVTTGRC